MKRKSRKHKSYDKKKQKFNKGKSFSVSRPSKILVKKRWVGRKKTLSPYPYLITIAYYKTNVFFIAADIQGQTKAWTSIGRSGFKKKDKTTYMAIVRVTELFFRKIWLYGIRQVIFNFRNCAKRRVRAAIRFVFRKIQNKYRFKYLGFFVQRQMAFNGCKKKKARRK